MYKDVIEKYMQTVWNEKDLSVIPQVFSQNAVIHSPVGSHQTSQQMAEIVKEWITAIPDLHVELQHTLEEKGVVISHWMAHGTHQKELKGIEATDRSVHYRGVSIYRFDQEQVVEYWAYVDKWKFNH